ncbi:MAG: ribose-phosphate diphosphokinase [Methanocellales archaeon]|nr:ribose-phosphate diphosphokinase [Methanocellales archaeon]
MKIIGGPASQLLATRVASELDCELALVEYKRFPDGETYVRVLDEIDDVVIIQSMISDEDLIYLLQLIDACSDASVKVVIPYFGYARQGKRFQPGEAISARVMAKTIEADEVLTVNIHDPSVLDYFKVKARDLDAAPLIGRYMQSLDLRKPIFIGPDEFAGSLARSVASKLGADYDVLEKKRLSGEEVKIKAKHLDVANRDVILIDDMISTGGTMAEAIELLRRQKSNDTYIACIHPILAKNAVVKLFKAGVKEIIATDTVEGGVSIISVAPLIARALD